MSDPAPVPSIFDQLRDKARAAASDNVVRVEPADMAALRKAAVDAQIALQVGMVDRYEALCRALAKSLGDTWAAAGFAPMTDDKALAIITQRFPISELEAVTAAG